MQLSADAFIVILLTQATLRSSRGCPGCTDTRQQVSLSQHCYLSDHPMLHVDREEATSDSESMSSSVCYCLSDDSTGSSVHSAPRTIIEEAAVACPFGPHSATCAQVQAAAPGNRSAGAAAVQGAEWQGGTVFSSSSSRFSDGGPALMLRAPRLALKRPAPLSLPLSAEPLGLMEASSAVAAAAGDHNASDKQQQCKRTRVGSPLAADECAPCLTGVDEQVNFAPIIQAAITGYNASSLSVDVYGPRSMVTLQPCASTSSMQRRSEGVCLAPQQQPACCELSAAGTPKCSGRKPVVKPSPLEVPAEWCNSKCSSRNVRRPLDFGLDLLCPTLQLPKPSGLETGVSSGSCAASATTAGDISSSLRAPCAKCGEACAGQGSGPDPLDAWMRKMEEMGHHSVWSPELESSAVCLAKGEHEGTGAPRCVVPPPAFTLLSMMGYELP